MRVETMPLTKEQVATMTGEPADWLRLTTEQELFVRETGPGQICTFYGDSILKLSGERMAESMEVAFKTACKAALELLGEPLTESVDLKCQAPGLGQIYLRVTATNAQGKTASAIGMIPDPRGH